MIKKVELLEIYETGGERIVIMRIKRNHHGQSLVEFALILPLLLMLVLGAIDFGRLFYTKIIITNAAREGAYYLVSHTNSASVIADATSAAEAEAQNAGVTSIAVIFNPNSGFVPNEPVEVTVTATVPGLLVLGLFDGIAQISTISSTAEMMVWQ